MGRKRRDDSDPDTTPDTSATTEPQTVSDNSATDDTPPPVDAAAKFKAARELREKCVALLGEKRANGDPLSDIAIASRLGVTPSYVAGVRAQHKPATTPEPVAEPVSATPQEEATPEEAEDEAVATDDVRLTHCPHCQAICQRIGYYCTDCRRYIPMPDPDATEAQAEAVVQKAMEAQVEKVMDAVMKDSTVSEQPIEKPARKPRVRKSEPAQVKKTPTAPDTAVPEVAAPLNGTPVDGPVQPLLGAEAAREYLARKETEGRDYLLGQLAGLEAAMRRFPDLIALAYALTPIRKFVEARLASAPVSELEKLDSEAKSRGLLLKAWAIAEDLQAHPPLRQFGVFVRNMLQAEEELQIEAEGK